MGSSSELWIDIESDIDDSVDFVEGSIFLAHDRVIQSSHERIT
jgi:hypothetical protein